MKSTNSTTLAIAMLLVSLRPALAMEPRTTTLTLLNLPGQEAAQKEKDRAAARPGATANAAKAKAKDNTRTSARLGAAADDAGVEFVKGAEQIAVPFIVVGRTVKNGTKYIALKGAQGLIYVGEQFWDGLERFAENVRVIAIEVENGIRWVAVKAIETGKLVIDTAVKTTKVVIDGVTYVLVQINDKFTYVAQKTLELAEKTGKLVIDGVTYAYEKTVDGVIWVATGIQEVFHNTYLLARNSFVSFRIHRKLATSLGTGTYIDENIEYFKKEATHPDSDPATRRLAESALKAATAYKQSMTRGR